MLLARDTSRSGSNSVAIDAMLLRLDGHFVRVATVKFDEYSDASASTASGYVPCEP